jgi:hypothetical protein
VVAGEVFELTFGMTLGTLPAGYVKVPMSDPEKRKRSDSCSK